MVNILWVLKPSVFHDVRVTAGNAVPLSTVTTDMWTAGGGVDKIKCVVCHDGRSERNHSFLPAGTPLLVRMQW